jgi:hypothetical protein
MRWIIIKKFLDLEFQDLFIVKRNNELLKYDDKRANETQQACKDDTLF